MFQFLKRKSMPIALDIGTGCVRMLQLRRVGSRLAAVAGAWQNMGVSAVPEDPAQRRRRVLDAIADMLRTGTFHGRRVVSSLPTGQLSIKNVRLPHMGPAELREAVKWEAKERFGFEVNGDQLSYLVAGQVRQGNESRDEVIMVAAPPRMVEDHLELLQEAGLKPEHIDAEPIALFRGFERFLRRAADEQSVTIVVDIGLTGSHVVVARGRQIVFIKAIDIGGRKFTEAVAKQLNLSLEEAHEMRQRIVRDSDNSDKPISDDTEASSAPAPTPASTPAAAPPSAGSASWTLRDGLRGEAEALAREIALCLRYCSVTFRGLRPDRVTIVGGEANDAAVVDLLGEHLGIECVVGQPLRGIDTSAVELGGDRRGTLAEWTVCAGLAVRDAQAFGSHQGKASDQERLSA